MDVVTKTFGVTNSFPTLRKGHNKSVALLITKMTGAAGRSQPAIAQLVERRTVVVAVILRSVVQIRLAGNFLLRQAVSVGNYSLDEVLVMTNSCSDTEYQLFLWF